MIKRLARKLLSPWLWDFTSAELGLGSLSWSQFGEDRLVASLFPKDHVGTYVDVGAFHPIYLSNSYAFYRRGWRGIAIDANPDVSAFFTRWRPEDKFVHAAVGTQPGMVTLRRFEVGAFNCLDEHSSSVPEQFRNEMPPVSVERRPLSSILKGCAVDQIDWFNIDCEGADVDILESNDWSRWRPSVVCVEDHSEHWQSSEVTDCLQGKAYQLRFRSGLSSVFIDRAGK